MDTREDLPPIPPLPSGASSAEKEEGLEQVRDLLFGPQIRSQERRVVRLEERIAREVAAMRSDLKLRLDAVKDEVTRELSTLSRTVAEEQVERGRLQESLSRRIDESGGALDARLEELRTEAEQAHEELRQVAEQAVQELREEVRNGRERERRALSTLFSELGSRLGSDADTPEAQS